MKKFLKNYWLIIFLAFIASLLFGLFFIQKNKQPEQVKLEENLLPIPSPKFKEYRVETPLNFNNLYKNLDELPSTGIVYEVGNFSFSEQEAIKIAEKFNFKTPPNFKNFENRIYYDWSDLEKDLTINLTEGNLNFVKKNLNLDSLSSITLPDLSEINSVIESTLKEKGLYPNEGINLSIKNLSYLKAFGLQYGITNNPQEAFAIEVELQYKINNLPLLGNEAKILIGDKNEILKLEYQSVFKNLQTFKTYPLKDKIEIMENLKLINSINYFKIINDYELSGEPEDIKTINLDKIELVYVKGDIPQSYLQPIFYITGQATLNDGRVAEVGIYLPAIKDEYLIK